MKKILIISSSPRSRSNSEALCRKFMEGALDAGHEVEMISLRKLKINYCTGCSVCSRDGKECPQKDDAAMVIGKMLNADTIVLSTPVYFYSMSAQIKTLIDRCCGKYVEMKGKEFYFIAAAAEENNSIMKRIETSFSGFLDCLESPVVKGSIFCGGVWHEGEIEGRPELSAAYEAGRNA